LLDRIDMHVEVPAVAARELTKGVRRRRVVAEDSVVQATEDATSREPGTGSLPGEGEPEPSASVRGRVMAARRVQDRRFALGERGPDSDGARESIHCNAQMGIREIEIFCQIDDVTRALLHKAMETRSMSARAVHRVLRVARTIADLAGAADLALDQVAEAVQYQTLTDHKEE
jgi:magnesium chelatase family protein